MFKSSTTKVPLQVQFLDQFHNLTQFSPMLHSIFPENVRKPKKWNIGPKWVTSPDFKVNREKLFVLLTPGCFPKKMPVCSAQLYQLSCLSFKKSNEMFSRLP